MKTNVKNYPCWLYHKKEEAVLCGTSEEVTKFKKKGYDKWAVIFGKEESSNDESGDDNEQESNQADYLELTIKQIKAKLIKDYGFEEKDFSGLKKPDLADMLGRAVEDSTEE